MSKDQQARMARRKDEWLHRYLQPGTWKGYWGWVCPNCGKSRRKYTWSTGEARLSRDRHRAAGCS